MPNSRPLYRLLDYLQPPSPCTQVDSVAPLRWQLGLGVEHPGLKAFSKNLNWFLSMDLKECKVYQAPGSESQPHKCIFQGRGKKINQPILVIPYEEELDLSGPAYFKLG